jgi:hypothetical protein
MSRGWRKEPLVDTVGSVERATSGSAAWAVCRRSVTHARRFGKVDIGLHCVLGWSEAKRRCPLKLHARLVEAAGLIGKVPLDGLPRSMFDDLGRDACDEPCTNCNLWKYVSQYKHGVT